MNEVYTPTVEDLASECADRATHPRQWISARNYVLRLQACEEALRKIERAPNGLVANVYRKVAREALRGNE